MIDRWPSPDPLLDRVRDVAEVVAGTHLLDRGEQRGLVVSSSWRAAGTISPTPTVIAASATQPS